MTRLQQLRERYVRQLQNPHLARLGEWRVSNDEAAHNDETYKANLIKTANAIHLKAKVALEGL